MNESKLKQALLVRLKARDGMDDELQAFLNAAQVSALQERGTKAWYALKFGHGEYAVFDAFADDVHGEDHVRGPIATALMLQAGTLLQHPPTISRLELLACKLPPAGAAVAPAKGLLMNFRARAGHEQRVEQLLRETRDPVLRETGTPAWFALRMEDGRYGIFDVFGNASARVSHLLGRGARKLAKRAWSLSGALPEMRLADVLAHKQEG